MDLLEATAASEADLAAICDPEKVDAWIEESQAINDPDLQRLASVWADLPTHVKQAILMMARQNIDD